MAQITRRTLMAAGASALAIGATQSAYAQGKPKLRFSCAFPETDLRAEGYKAFAAAQKKTYADLAETAALKAMLPWLVAHVEQARREMGSDWWSYGLAPNRHVLETFLRYHREQGLSRKRLAPEDLFAAETAESFRI